MKICGLSVPVDPMLLGAVLDTRCILISPESQTWEEDLVTWCTLRLLSEFKQNHKMI